MHTPLHNDMVIPLSMLKIDAIRPISHTHTIIYLYLDVSVSVCVLVSKCKKHQDRKHTADDKSRMLPHS